MTTIETLTDEQIQELHDSLANGDPLTDADLFNCCEYLLGIPTFVGMKADYAKRAVVNEINRRELEARPATS